MCYQVGEPVNECVSSFCLDIYGGQSDGSGLILRLFEAITRVDKAISTISPALRYDSKSGAHISRTAASVYLVVYQVCNLAIHRFFAE